MKYCILLLSCFFFSVILPGQTDVTAAQEYFSLQGGTFHEGSLMRRYDIRFDLNKKSFRPETHIVLDSIAVFLLKHPELTIQISNHTDYENPNYSSKLTQSRACAVRDYLVKQTVPNSQLICIGYGHHRKLIPDSLINKEKSKVKQDSLRALNRRMEFRIRSVDANLVPLFSFTDTVFFAGQVWRNYAILFDMSKSTLRPESKVIIDSIAKFMRDHPGISIEVGTHTDCRGSDPFNQKLSQARAHSVYDYLVSTGIDANRLRYYGYGETQPFTKEAAISQMKTKEEMEKAHQQNRRTEFKIISAR